MSMFNISNIYFSGPPPNHDSANLNAIPLPPGPAPAPRVNPAAGSMPPGGPQGSAPPMPSAPPGGHSQHKPEFVDPAIMSMGSMPLPPPPSRAVFPAGPPPQSKFVLRNYYMLEKKACEMTEIRPATS